MANRFVSLLPRLAVLVVVWVFASGTLTFAAVKRIDAHAQAQAPKHVTRPTLVVPDVRNQAFVFAKGILQDAGFAWKVGGGAGGFSTNLVGTQQPLPGTRVVDTGAPTLVLHLVRGHYPELGTPDSRSPYAGTAIVLPSSPNSTLPRPIVSPKLGKALRDRLGAKPMKAPAAPPAVKPLHPKPVRKAAVPTARTRSARPAAFLVPGAPKEPLDEIALPVRAQRLSAWLTPARKPSDANVKYWLYQHAWIVAGAKFGWWHGDEALRTLIGVDARVDAQWGVGARSARVARKALALVEAKTK
jgi:hypothetical protein